jgi:hypothetical protein
VLLVDHEVARLQVAEVGEEAAQAATPSPRVEMDLFRKDVAVGEDREAGVRHLEPAGEDAHPGEDAAAVADHEAVLAQHVGEAVGAPGVAEEYDRGRGRVAEVVREAAHVAGVGGRGAAGQVEGTAGGVDLAYLEAGFRAEARLEGGKGDERFSGRAQAPARRARSSTARAQKISASCFTSSGSITATGPGGRWAHGGTVAPGTRATSSASPSGWRPRWSESRKGASSRRPAKRPASTPGSAARTERVAKTSASGRVTRASTGPVARCVSGSKRRRLSTVSPKNSMRTGSGWSEGRRPGCPAARHLPRRGHRVLARVAALVEGLQQDLRGHLVALSKADDARLQEARREARAQEAGRRGHER